MSPPRHPRILGLGGIALIVIGCFAPLAVLPPGGVVTFYGGGHGDGTFVLALMAVSLWLVLAPYYRVLLAVAAATAALALPTVFRLHELVARAQQDVIDQRGSLLMHSDVIDPAYLDWGWAPLAIGTLCLAAAALLGWRNRAA